MANGVVILLGSLLFTTVALSLLLRRSRKESRHIGDRLFASIIMFEESKNKLRRMEKQYIEPTNVCENCVNSEEALSIQLADTGRCSICGDVGECWDLDLINLYKSFSISDQIIWEELPRLLNTHLNKSERHSLVDIKNKLLELTTNN